MMAELTPIALFLAWIVGSIFVVYIHGRRRDRRQRERGPECTVHFGLVRISLSALGGSVRISSETAEKLEISSGIEAHMFRGSEGRLLPKRGFGRDRAIPVMVSPDDSLARTELVVSAEDAKALGLDDGGHVMISFKIRRPQTIMMNAYQGKVPFLGIPLRRVIVQPKGPHKVRLPSDSFADGDLGRKRS